MPEVRFPGITYAGNWLSEKNSSRKLAEQARSRTPRYRIGVRVYVCRFLRRTLLGDSMNKRAAIIRSKEWLRRLSTSDGR